MAASDREHKESNDDYVLVIGDALSGKSTVVNHLLGVTLEFDIETDYLKASPNQKISGPIINHNSRSPSRLLQQFKCHQVTLVDCPSLGDENNENAIRQFVATHANIRNILAIIPFEYIKGIQRSHDDMFAFLYRLNKIIDLKKIKEREPLPIVFVVSKPPEPTNIDRIFNPEKIESRAKHLLNECRVNRHSTEMARLIESEKSLDLDLKKCKRLQSIDLEGAKLILRQLNYSIQDIKERTKRLGINFSYEDVWVIANTDIEKLSLDEVIHRITTVTSKINAARRLENYSAQLEMICDWLQLIHNQNIFVLRCVTNLEQGDKPDHKDNLLSYLELLRRRCLGISDIFLNAKEQPKEEKQELVPVKAASQNKPAEGWISWIYSLWAKPDLAKPDGSIEAKPPTNKPG